MKSSTLTLYSTLLLLANCETAPQKKEASAPSPAPQSTVGTVPASQPTPTTTDSSGVVTTASGLQYKVLASGSATGRSPTRSDSVTVHYRGTLTNGVVFDSSYDRGMPATFGVGQVIAGWTEALQLMKPGDKWLLHIPSHLAYGGRSVGDKIPPNSDLNFQVELLQIVGAP